MSRRDNGLPGGEWQRLVELAPPVADHVLDVLRDEGIAAYAAPSTRTGPYLESQGARPLDQVFVTAGAVDEARALVDRLLPELDDDRALSEDDVWASIVAAFDAAPADPLRRPESVPTELAEPDRAPAGETGSAATGFEDIRDEIDAMRAEREQAETARPEAHDPTDHYVPPPPPPLPEVDNVTRLAWVGLVGGPLFLVLATLLDWGPTGLVGLIAVMAFVGGFVTLVTRMRDYRDDEDDDGAVV